MPPLLESIDALRRLVQGWRSRGESVVLVPTMGALHAGHLALVAQAGMVGRRVVVSIFVNPTQFGPAEDLSRYPRDIEGDLARLSETRVDIVWAPRVETMYPDGFTTGITLSGPSEGLCGAFRPGHFSGVATVVTKLLNQVRPDVALFGEKDFQQLRVIQRVVRDLDMSYDIRGVPTVREADGLALSSRNRYLGAADRARAPRLHETLSAVANRLAAGNDVAAELSRGIETLEAAGFAPVQYLELCDAESLEPLSVANRPGRLLAAAYLGSTRLIDNVPVGIARSV